MRLDCGSSIFGILFTPSSPTETASAKVLNDRAKDRASEKRGWAIRSEMMLREAFSLVETNVAELARGPLRTSKAEKP